MSPHEAFPDESDDRIQNFLKTLEEMEQQDRMVEEAYLASFELEF